MSTVKAIVLNKRPTDRIVPGETFRTEERPAPQESDLKDGEVIYEACYLGLEPAMRGWMSSARSYIAPVEVGAVMRGGTVGVIKASKSAKLPKGSFVSPKSLDDPGWSEQAVLNEKGVYPVKLTKGVKLLDVLGVLGATGLTAYFGIIDVGKVKSDDLVVVSGAAGATGSVVCQIAKLKGARVVGIAGSDDKVSWLKNEIGCDEALNYKSPDFKQQFRDATKGFIDVFFDNVGGEVLDMALERAKAHARFVICGGISQYNKAPDDIIGPKRYLNIISQRITMQGFIIFDYQDQWPRAREQLAAWVGEGKLKGTETVIKGGLLKAEEALGGLFTGRNTGKMLVEVNSPPESASQSSL